MFVRKHLIDILSEVVDSLRINDTITAFVENFGNVYVIDTLKVSELTINDYISITLPNNTIIDNIVITAIDLVNSNFTIKLNTSIVLTGAIWKLNKPYYDFEKYLAESNDLALKDKSINFKFQKYPLIFLLLDIQESREPDLANYTEYQDVKIIFAVQTDKTKDAKWRHVNTMPKLRKLYSDFMNKLFKNQYVSKAINQKAIPHTYSELFYLGSADQNQNKFKDYVDVVEITINSLLIKKNC